jgi:ATP-dependent exoDNAse (exonuclease V) alpha subunit
LRSVTSAPQQQFLAVVVVPEQVHPHRSALFQARRVQVTSQQQLQHVADMLRAADLIVWDEAPMVHRHAFEALDRTLRDIMQGVNAANANKLFGGKVVLFGGDFRQVLPVIPRGTRGQIVNAAFNQSQRLWPHIVVHRLHENMRVQTLRAAGDASGAARQQEFAAWLQRVGEGTEPTCPAVGEDFIRLPDEIVCGGGQREGTLQELIDGVYGELGNLQSADARQEYIVERAILTPLNDDVDSVNDLMTTRMCARRDGGEVVESRVYNSADSVVRGEQTDFMYPTEFLNTLSMSGLPPHKLHLHVGCPIILMRNMSAGLANGTRLVVTRLMENVIQAKVATGPAKGQLVMLPRLNTVPSDRTSLPFDLCRRQFPVRVAYAMTINKAQGQTLKAAGVYLPRSVFSHGQLYVALSRVGIWEALKVLVVGGFHAATAAVAAGVYTKNVVYREVFQGVRA